MEISSIHNKAIEARLVRITDNGLLMTFNHLYWFELQLSMSGQICFGDSIALYATCS